MRAFFQVRWRIADLGDLAGVGDVQTPHQLPNHVRKRATPRDFVAGDDRVNRRAHAPVEPTQDHVHDRPAETGIERDLDAGASQRPECLDCAGDGVHRGIGRVKSIHACHEVGVNAIELGQQGIRPIGGHHQAAKRLGLGQPHDGIDRLERYVQARLGQRGADTSVDGVAIVDRGAGHVENDQFKRHRFLPVIGTQPDPPGRTRVSCPRRPPH